MRGGLLTTDAPICERCGFIRCRCAEAPPTDCLPDAPPRWADIASVFAAPGYGDGLPPVTSGFATIDDALRGGFRPESLYVLAGRTGAAKSTLAANIARKAALSGVCVLHAKLEESLAELVWRMHAAAAQVDLVRLLNGAKHASESERARLVDGYELLRDLPIRLTGERNLRELERIALAHAADGGGLMIVDQTSMVDAPGEIGYQRATEVSNRLRLLAREAQIPILLVSQATRTASKAKERLGCNDLRDSGALENDAAAVLIIDRARPGLSRTDPLVIEMVVGKNRYGASTRDDDQPLELLWWPACCRIEDAARIGQGGEF